MNALPRFLLIVPLAMGLAVVEADTASADCAWDQYAKIDHWDLQLVDVTVDGEQADEDSFDDRFQVSLRSGDAQHVMYFDDQEGDESFEAAFRRAQTSDVPQDFAAQLADNGGEQ